MWQDENGNRYTVEKSARNGHFVAVRVNPGNHRKAYKEVAASRSERRVRQLLDEVAARSGWVPVQG